MKKLEVNQMASYNGGIGAAEYCHGLAVITQNNSITGGAAQGTMSGFLAAGCGGEGYGMEVNGAGQVIVFRREQ
jgi:hypothetical protein